MRLRTRIAATYITLTVAVVLLVSLLSSWQIKKFLEARATATLTAQVSLLAQQCADRGQSGSLQGSDDSAFLTFARALGVRVSLIDKDGRVLFDTGIPRDSLTFLENHKDRPEINAARDGRVGTALRFSNSLAREFLYAAKRIMVPSNPALDSGFVRLALPAVEARELDERVQAAGWLVGLLAILFVAAVSIHMARRITRPILDIAQTAEAITGGNLKVRVPASSHDEIGSLGTAINRMAETLSNDIERLRKLERVRSEFLANVSHELRTPIFSIQGFLETLIDGAVDDPAVNREFLAKAHRHAERLNDLLNDLIEISRIESGEMKMSHRYFPVREFLELVADDMRPLAERKGIALILADLPDDQEKVYGDRERLKQVMVNLVENAIKYTDSGGTIEVRTELANHLATITVSDTGRGIAENQMNRIFERFYRVDKDRARDVGGTGLGLAIVKHIVEAHDGTIGVRSTVGKGSDFSFTLKR